jgi:hypothetical protein
VSLDLIIAKEKSYPMYKTETTSSHFLDKKPEKHTHVIVVNIAELSAL